MLHVRENADGSKRILTDSEAFNEDMIDGLLISGAPIVTMIAWLPAAALLGLTIFGKQIGGELGGLCLGFLSLPTTVILGAYLKRFIGNLSGIAGLVAAYAIFQNFG